MAGRGPTSVRFANAGSSDLLATASAEGGRLRPRRKIGKNAAEHPGRGRRRRCREVGRGAGCRQPPVKARGKFTKVKKCRGRERERQIEESKTQDEGEGAGRAVEPRQLLPLPLPARVRGRSRRARARGRSGAGRVELNECLRLMAQLSLLHSSSPASLLGARSLSGLSSVAAFTPESRQTSFRKLG